MIHIRVDDYETNEKQTMACGIVGTLPDGDKYFFAAESAADRLADCPVCNPHPRKLGTPISQLSGRPGHPGFEQFKAIARSWGYE